MPAKPNASLLPRNGHTLVVGIVARISGCPNQKELSLDDQVDHAKQEVAGLYPGPADYRIVATKGKGERLDRPELAEVEGLLRSRELDLLVAEDIGRLVRGTEAARLLGIAVDHGTRVVAPNDFIDTADPTWEEDVISACRDHVGHNSHTSKRLKNKLMNRFKKFGGATARPVYGYVLPDGAKTYDDWQRDPAATPIYQEWFRRLAESPNCTAVADWLNARDVPTGPYARRATWTGSMVRRLTRNPLVKGSPGRGFKHTIKVHESGRRVSVPNPEGPTFKECPHLAHVEPALWAEVNALLDAANAKYRRKPVNGADPLWRVPRKRTRFPGQHAVCWYCGRRLVWGGNGINGYLMCSGVRENRCWNSASISGAAAARKLTEAITTELCRLDGFDEQFRGLLERAGQEGGADQARRYAEMAGQEEALARQKDNLLAAIADYGPKPMFQVKLAELEAEERRLAAERRVLERRRDREVRLPASVAELRRELGEKFRALATDSPEFGDLLRRLVPEFHVYLVRLWDGGHLLPRARVRLDLAGDVPDAGRVPGLRESLARHLTLDLFEPPQRERIRAEAVGLAGQGLEQREVARRLPERPRQATVHKALALDREMRARGLTAPYVLVAEPPADYAKLCRYRNPRFRFEPVQGYVRPPL